jgi:hypothetical protein
VVDMNDIMREYKKKWNFVGRGTRLYDDKDYFTIYDFVKAHHHFSDPEWDGEPIEPVDPKLCPKCSRAPRTSFLDGAKRADLVTPK